MPPTNSPPRVRHRATRAARHVPYCRSDPATSGQEERCTASSHTDRAPHRVPGARRLAAAPRAAPGPPPGPPWAAHEHQHRRTRRRGPPAQPRSAVCRAARRWRSSACSSFRRGAGDPAHRRAAGSAATAWRRPGGDAALCLRRARRGGRSLQHSVPGAVLKRRFVFSLGALSMADQRGADGRRIGCPRSRSACRSASWRLAVSRSPASSTCWTTSRGTSCGTSSQSASSPVPGRGRLAPGWASICNQPGFRRAVRDYHDRVGVGGRIVLVAAPWRERSDHLDPPPATEPGALSATLFRPAAAAPGLDAGGRPLGLVADVLRVYADLRGDLRARCRNRRRDRLDRVGVDVAGAAVGLGRPALWTAAPADGRIRDDRRAEHLSPRWCSTFPGWAR